jgi:hypothetical protein
MRLSWALTLTAFVLAAGLILECGCAERRVVRQQPAPPSPARPLLIAQGPPPPPVEVVGAAPAPEYIWAPGVWQWHQRWVWVSGRWAHRPQPDAVWVQGHWIERTNGWVWIRGYWR